MIRLLYNIKFQILEKNIQFDVVLKEEEINNNEKFAIYK